MKDGDERRARGVLIASVVPTLLVGGAVFGLVGATVGSSDPDYTAAPREQVLADIRRHCEVMTLETAATPEQTSVHRALLESMDPGEVVQLEAECLGAGLANRTRDRGSMEVFHFAAKNSYASSLTTDGWICLVPRVRNDNEAAYDPAKGTAEIGSAIC